MLFARRTLQPSFRASRARDGDGSERRLSALGDYGFDETRQCWWATDARDRQYRFVVEEITAVDKAAQDTTVLAAFTEYRSST
jgi:hypothetical protein